MRNAIPFLTLSIAASICFSCQANKGDAPSQTTTFTIREIMQSMVEPRATSLWNAVSTSVTDKGIETNAPSNDEEWANIRHEAVTLSESMNVILAPGRMVAKPGEQAKDPAIELSPEQIEKLIREDRESWAKLAHALQDSVAKAIRAVDAKNADDLSSAGADIDQACETCHKKYWYPNEEKAGKD